MSRRIAKYNFNFLIVLILIWATMTGLSCKTTRKIIKNPLKDKNPEFLFEQLKNNELKFNYLAASFSAEATINNSTNTFGGNLRIKRDSLIWLSVSKMAIEIVRLNITPDSLFLMNRINRTFYSGGFNDLNKTFDTDFDFDILQSLIVGNDLSFYENNIFKSSIDGDRYKLSTMGRHKLKKFIKNEMENQKVLIQNIWLNPDNFKISANFLKEIKNENRKLVTTYSRFTAVGNQLFPFKVSIDIQAENPVIINVNYSKVKVDEETSFPFNIPSNYTREKNGNTGDEEMGNE